MMIEKLKGRFDVSLPSGMILDVNGVGYGIEMPLSALCSLPPLGTPMEVWTYTYVREDVIKLYGFLTFEDRYIFEVLISLNGVGPKIALAILSTLDLNAIKMAVFQANAGIFEVVPGIGPRLAEKIIVEMKPKMKRLSLIGHHSSNEPNHQRLSAEDFPGQEDDKNQGHSLLIEDLRSALENLGFRDKAVAPVIQKLQNEFKDADFQTLMRHALKELRGVKAEVQKTAGGKSAAQSLF